MSVMGIYKRSAFRLAFARIVTHCWRHTPGSKMASSCEKRTAFQVLPVF
jgi:hypothetical protein